MLSFFSLISTPGGTKWIASNHLYNLPSRYFTVFRIIYDTWLLLTCEYVTQAVTVGKARLGAVCGSIKKSAHVTLYGFYPSL